MKTEEQVRTKVALLALQLAEVGIDPTDTMGQVRVFGAHTTLDALRWVLDAGPSPKIMAACKCDDD